MRTSGPAEDGEGRENAGSAGAPSPGAWPPGVCDQGDRSPAGCGWQHLGTEGAHCPTACREDPLASGFYPFSFPCFFFFLIEVLLRLTTNVLEGLS